LATVDIIAVVISPVCWRRQSLLPVGRPGARRHDNLADIEPSEMQIMIESLSPVRDRAIDILTLAGS